MSRTSAIVGLAETRWVGGCGAPATRSQTTRGFDALSSLPSGLKLRGELDLSPAICASGEPRPGQAAHRLAQLAHHVGIDARLGHRLVRRRLIVAAGAVTALTRWRVRRFWIRLAGRGVEQRDAVAEARGNPAAVAAERERRRAEVEVHLESGLGQRAHLAPRPGVDQVHRPGQRLGRRIHARRQELAVGTERDAAHAQRVVRRQLLQLPAGRELEDAQPAAHGRVPRAALDELRDDQAAVRAEAQVGRGRQVACQLERLHFLARRDVDHAQGPGTQAAAEPHDAVLVGEASAQGRQFPVRRQRRGHLIHGPGRRHAFRLRVGARLHRRDLASAGQVVDLDLVVPERRQPPAVFAERHVLHGARVGDHSPSTAPSRHSTRARSDRRRRRRSAGHRAKRPPPARPDRARTACAARCPWPCPRSSASRPRYPTRGSGRPG